MLSPGLSSIVSFSIQVSFYCIGIVWDHCHAEELGCCLSDAFQMVLHGGSQDQFTKSLEAQDICIAYPPRKKYY